MHYYSQIAQFERGNNLHVVPGDFNVMNQPVEIPIGATKSCIRLEAADDEIVEADEILILVIETIHSNDRVDGNTTVVISDSDCKIIN